MYISEELPRSYCANIDEICGSVYDVTPPQTDEEKAQYEAAQEYYDSL